MSQKHAYNLNPNQIEFCKLYATDKEYLGNGVLSYIEAYDLDMNEKNAYNNARARASELLTKRSILEYIDKLLDADGFNDQFVDKQHLFLIRQNAELPVKRAAINDYNKLKQRIKDKIDLNATGPVSVVIQSKFSEEPDKSKDNDK